MEKEIMKNKMKESLEKIEKTRKELELIIEEMFYEQGIEIISSLNIAEKKIHVYSGLFNFCSNTRTPYKVEKYLDKEEDLKKADDDESVVEIKVDFEGYRLFQLLSKKELLSFLEEKELDYNEL